ALRPSSDAVATIPFALESHPATARQAGPRVPVATEQFFEALLLHKLFGNPEPRVELAPFDFVDNILLDGRPLFENLRRIEHRPAANDVQERQPQCPSRSTLMTSPSLRHG